MLKTFLLNLLLVFSAISDAEIIPVKNSDELKAANKRAKPGDVIILQNGEWKDVIISLNSNGTKEKPVTFKAQTSGKVIITGYSKLMVGGNFIVVDGLHFTKGYAGKDAVIKFKTDKNEIANNSRVTNTVIDGFNNEKRMDENTWVYFYGKNNRIDHSSFLNKLNMGVLMAVILDDERSRENFHSIDHNYFGLRLPLASNTGETIRVGVSEHCEFNSNTLITDNFFEKCDGETEIISIKSGRNIIRNNVFKECQGSVVLRHGDNNTVENNIFLGNNKEGSGGVRVINKGQWVINNLFYKTRGTWFKSPLAIMNGVPNSPANRYVAVSDAFIANNTFYETTPIGLGIGSDTERSVAPRRVMFHNNVFYNTSDSVIYNSYDDIDGIYFANNRVSAQVQQTVVKGFHKISMPVSVSNNFDKLESYGHLSPEQKEVILAESKIRLANPLVLQPFFKDISRFSATQKNTIANSGASWFAPAERKSAKARRVICKDAASVLKYLADKNERIIIHLTGNHYNFTRSLIIDRDVTFTSKKETGIKFSSDANYLLHANAGGVLSFENIHVDLTGVKNFITTDTSGKSAHHNLRMRNARFENLKGTFLNASKSALADSIVIDHCTFRNYSGDVFEFDNETTAKGLYNVEKLKITNSVFENGSGTVSDMVRGGNDESTMGPHFVFSGNQVINCSSKEPLIELYGTQRSEIENNVFINSNPQHIILQYVDVVKAYHLLKGNRLENSGKIVKNKFVVER